MEVATTFFKKVVKTFCRRHFQDILKTSSGGLEYVFTRSSKKVVATSISNQSKTSLRPKLKTYWDVFKTFSGKSRRPHGYHKWTFYIRAF